MDQISKIVTEPSFGQINQIQYLMDSATIKDVEFIPFELELESIDITAMEKTVSFFITRHESLRTIFPIIEGEIKQVILPFDIEKFGVNYMEVGSAKFQDLKDQVYNVTREIFSKLGEGPLVKMFLIKKDNNIYFFSMLIHHLICDEWSLNIIKDELYIIYNSYLIQKEPDLKPLTFQLKDYCRNLNKQLMDNKFNSMDFWSKKLNGIQGALNMGKAYDTYLLKGNTTIDEKIIVRFDSQQSLIEILDQHSAAMYSSVILNDKLSMIKSMAKRLYCSVSSILYSSFYLFIYIYMGKNKILLAALIADRGDLDKGGLIGCLLGGIYLPNTITKEKVIKNLINETFSGLLEGIQNIIFNHYLLELDGEKLRANCDIYLNYISKDTDIVQANPEFLKIHKQDDGIYYALNCMVFEYNNGISVSWRYNKALFTEDMIKDMVECQEQILSYMIENEASTAEDLTDFIHLSRY